METNSLNPTTHGRLPHSGKGGRKAVPIRLAKPDHKELQSQAKEETRSMSFIAMRRYLKGRELEIEEANQ